MPLAKVSTDRLTKGVSMSRNERMKIVWVKSENIEMAHTKKPSPTTGKVSALADGRGKREQTQENKNKKRFND